MKKLIVDLLQENKILEHERSLIAFLLNAFNIEYVIEGHYALPMFANNTLYIGVKSANMPQQKNVSEMMLELLFPEKKDLSYVKSLLKSEDFGLILYFFIHKKKSTKNVKPIQKEESKYYSFAEAITFFKLLDVHEKNIDMAFHLYLTEFVYQKSFIIKCNIDFCLHVDSLIHKH